MHKPIRTRELNSGSVIDVRNCLVEFRIADISFPPRDVILCELHGNDSLWGLVVDISDNGEREGKFVVVEANVKGAIRQLIVPLQSVRELERA